MTDSTPERVQLAFRRVDAALRSWTSDAVIAEDLDVLREATPKPPDIEWTWTKDGRLIIEWETGLTLNGNSTADTEPLVMMERDLAEWYAALLDLFASMPKRFDIRRKSEEGEEP